MIVAAAAVAALPAHPQQPYGNNPNLQRRFDFPTLQAAIGNARTVADFARIYDSSSFQMCLRYMHVRREIEDVGQWAQDWAIRMRNQDRLATDVVLDHCRKTTLDLLWNLLDLWHEGQISANEIGSHFKNHRFQNILTVALPLDQAQCLYQMRYPGAARYGMHWVAQEHVNAYPKWQDILVQCDGIPTMNQRYLWLMKHQDLQSALGLHQNELFRRLLLDLERNPHLDEDDMFEG
jgi:hypothetical protein